MKIIMRDYEYAIGKTIETVINNSNERQEVLEFVFTDGTYLEIRGLASGYDVEYEGLFYQYKGKQEKK